MWLWVVNDPMHLWSNPGQLSLHWLTVEIGIGGQFDNPVHAALSTDRINTTKSETLLVGVIGACEGDPLRAGLGPDSLLAPT